MGTYRVTGINLKTMPLGESDRLVWVLTAERGLLRLAAPGARKPKSGLGGRTALFVVNDLAIASGRSLDRIQQAETLHTFTGLSRSLAHLTAAQYLAELTLIQALTDQPQPELWTTLIRHLEDVQGATDDWGVLVGLNRGVYRLLERAGIAPTWDRCCATGQPLPPRDRHPFSAVAGGVVASPTGIPISHSLTAQQVQAFAELAASDPGFQPDRRWERITWLTMEAVLRACAHAHFERKIRAADLLSSCFPP